MKEWKISPVRLLLVPVLNPQSISVADYPYSERI